MRSWLQLQIQRSEDLEVTVSCGRSSRASLKPDTRWSFSRRGDISNSLLQPPEHMCPGFDVHIAPVLIAGTEAKFGWNHIKRKPRNRIPRHNVTFKKLDLKYTPSTHAKTAKTPNNAFHSMVRIHTVGRTKRLHFSLYIYLIMDALSLDKSRDIQTIPIITVCTGSDLIINEWQYHWRSLLYNYCF